MKILPNDTNWLNWEISNNIVEFPYSGRWTFLFFNHLLKMPSTDLKCFCTSDYNSHLNPFLLSVLWLSYLLSFPWVAKKHLWDFPVACKNCSHERLFIVGNRMLCKMGFWCDPTSKNLSSSVKEEWNGIEWNRMEWNEKQNRAPSPLSAWAEFKRKRAIFFCNTFLQTITIVLLLVELYIHVIKKFK